MTGANNPDPADAPEAFNPVADAELAAVKPPTPPVMESRARRDAASYDDGDATALHGAPDSTSAVDRATINWSEETNAQRIGLELRRIESEIRGILEQRDPKRKRKMAGTRRWQELEEDILSWRFTGRFEEETLRRLSEMIARRHFLFARLRFLAFTRPTWNS